MNKHTQKAWVYAQLKKGKRLTAVQAFEGCGAMRLAAIIYDMRADGIPVVTTTKYNGSARLAEYSLPKGWR